MTTPQSQPVVLQQKLTEFFESALREIKNCNVDASEDLNMLMHSPTQIEDLQSFIEDYADDLDACHPEAFDILYELATANGLST